MTVQDQMTTMRNSVSRRRFMGALGLAGVGAAGAVVAANGLPGGVPVAAEPAAPFSQMAGHDMSRMPDQQAAPDMTADEMDAMHEAGVKAFPAATAGLGGQPMPFTLDGDVKVYDITCDVVQWEFLPGKFVEAWCYNGVTPGPEIRVTEGDKVRFNVTNNMLQSTAIHWHGLILPNSQDGVPFLTQPPIKPGQTFTYEFQIREGNAGSHMYHSHMNAAEQVTRGLLGAFIVEPKDPTTRPAFDREFTVIFNDGPIGGYSLNGKSFPATQPFVAKRGERVLFRFMNEGLMIHPAHLHGMPMTVIAQDGYLVPQPYMCDTLNVAPGQRFEAIIEATEVGAWAFHCHVLSHVESDHGMFGMVTVFIVEE